MLKEYTPQEQTISKETRKQAVDDMRQHLSLQLQQIKEKKLPVLVIVEGWAAAGKGSLINELISEIDPRSYNVVTPKLTPEESARYPFLYPYATVIPQNGKILFMDAAWMEDVVHKIISGEITEAQYKDRIRSVNAFERQLRDNGYVVLKLFEHISKKTQKNRLNSLLDSPDTKWRVSKDDLWQHDNYDRFMDQYDWFMTQTSGIIPWYILDGSNRKFAVYEALKLLTDEIDAALDNGKYVGKPFFQQFPLLQMPKLSEVDLNKSIEDEDYKRELKRLQDKLAVQHNMLYRRRIPVILCYEGWDAAGKGGNIRRIAYPLDPRGLEVHPIASPEPKELAHHYLWRFWTRLPRSGHIAIFDRTWYGRVMVERLEGFCSEDDWKRAYNEINEFERDLTDWGAVVLKFWIHIDQDTQLARFNDRQNTPEKQWKLTDEDWRNREKWPQYEEAIDEMIKKTSTENAPWFIIESNDKKYARIRTLTILTDALDAVLNKKETKKGKERK